ncbi:MAG: precorrin-6A/cobalt-precorrin-6A reductase [Deltaproteobacteria bacterium]|nr:precorrin-6A/cobalt-precorrin-6A reductase [Deltaproteobacteria bacterium]
MKKGNPVHLSKENIQRNHDRPHPGRLFVVGIGAIVTKESGRAGGLDAKLAAARRKHCRVIVLRRPATPSHDPVFDRPAALIAALAALVPPD